MEKAASGMIKKIRIPNLLMFGAPGAGKGTYGGMMSTDLNFKNISTGDAIREFLNQDDVPEDMQHIKEIIESGKLLDDSSVMEIMGSRLANLDGFNGVILDGFPRNLSQAELFGQTIDTELSYVLNLVLDESVIRDKLSGRRLCQDCGTGYNFCEIDRNGYFMKPLLPKNPEHNCDKCGGKLIRREDDDPKVIQDRLDIYRKETEPVLEYFDKQNIPILSFEAKQGKKDYPTILEKINEGYFSGLDWDFGPDFKVECHHEL